MKRAGDSEPPACGAARAAVRMGRSACRVLMAGHGSVLAAFASTLYLESTGGIACIAPPSTPRGPLNVVMPGFVLPAAVELDRAIWRADEATLAIDRLGTFALSPRADWTPPRPPAMDAAALHAGLASMHAVLATRPLRGEVLPHVLGYPRLGFRAEAPGVRIRCTFTRSRHPPNLARPIHVSCGPSPLSNDGSAMRYTAEAHRLRGRPSIFSGPDAVSRLPVTIALPGCSLRCTHSGNVASRPRSRAPSPGTHRAAPAA